MRDVPEDLVPAARADAVCRGVRLTLPLRIGAWDDTIALEPAHLEWIVRIVAYAALRDGLLDAPASLAARILPGAIREWHGGVACLDSFLIELRDRRGVLVSLTELSRRVLQPFVTARAVHRVVEAGAQGTVAYASSVHAVDAD